MSSGLKSQFISSYHSSGKTDQVPDLFYRYNKDFVNVYNRIENNKLISKVTADDLSNIGHDKVKFLQACVYTKLTLFFSLSRKDSTSPTYRRQRSGGNLFSLSSPPQTPLHLPRPTNPASKSFGIEYSIKQQVSFTLTPHWWGMFPW